MRELRDCVLFVMAIALTVAVVLWGAVFLPIMYLDGHAKEIVIKEETGLDIPWYYASFLSTDRLWQHIDLDVSLEQSE